MHEINGHLFKNFLINLSQMFKTIFIYRLEARGEYFKNILPKPQSAEDLLMIL